MITSYMPIIMASLNHDNYNGLDTEIADETPHSYCYGDAELTMPITDSCVDTIVAENFDSIEEFYLALEEGSLETLENLILSAGFDVNLAFDSKYPFVKKKHIGWRAVHIAASQNKVKVCQFLLDQGADVDHVTPDGDTALHLTAKVGAADIVALLLEFNLFLRDRPNNQGVTALLKAIFTYQHSFKGNYRRCVAILLGAGCNPNIPSSSLVTPLHVAVDKGDPLLVRSLLNAGANVNARCNKNISSLFRALIAKHQVNSEVLVALLEAGADTSVKLLGRYALHIAVNRCDDRILKVFLKHGADPNVKDDSNKTPLWLAVEEDNLKVASILVAGGADIDHVKHPQALSILCLAITNDSYSMVKLLLKLGASTFTETIMWATPLHLAVDKRNTDIIKELMRYNCALDTTSNAKYALRPLAPLQQALEAGSLELIELLINCGCKVKSSWLKADNLFGHSQARRLFVVAHLRSYLSTVPPLSHLSRICYRKSIGPKFQQALKYMEEHSVLPIRLIESLYLKDIIESRSDIYLLS